MVKWRKKKKGSSPHFSARGRVGKHSISLIIYLKKHATRFRRTCLVKRSVRDAMRGVQLDEPRSTESRPFGDSERDLCARRTSPRCRRAMARHFFRNLRDLERFLIIFAAFFNSSFLWRRRDYERKRIVDERDRIASRPRRAIRTCERDGLRSTAASRNYYELGGASKR